jgi:hypothetical protein
MEDLLIFQHALIKLDEAIPNLEKEMKISKQILGRFYNKFNDSIKDREKINQELKKKKSSLKCAPTNVEYNKRITKLYKDRYACQLQVYQYYINQKNILKKLMQNSTNKELIIKYHSILMASAHLQDKSNEIYTAFCKFNEDYPVDKDSKETNEVMEIARKIKSE